MGYSQVQQHGLTTHYVLICRVSLSFTHKKQNSAFAAHSLNDYGTVDMLGCLYGIACRDAPSLCYYSCREDGKNIEIWNDPMLHQNWQQSCDSVSKNIPNDLWLPVCVWLMESSHMLVTGLLLVREKKTMSHNSLNPGTFTRYLSTNIVISFKQSAQLRHHLHSIQLNSCQTPCQNTVRNSTASATSGRRACPCPHNNNSTITSCFIIIITNYDEDWDGVF